MNTQEEYHKETGLYHYDSGSMDFKWNDEYVEWLEKRVEALTLTEVSQQRELLKGYAELIQSSYTTHFFDDAVEESIDEFLSL